MCVSVCVCERVYVCMHIYMQMCVHKSIMLCVHTVRHTCTLHLYTHTYTLPYISISHMISAVQYVSSMFSVLWISYVCPSLCIDRYTHGHVNLSSHPLALACACPRPSWCEMRTLRALDTPQPRPCPPPVLLLPPPLRRRRRHRLLRLLLL